MTGEEIKSLQAAFKAAHAKKKAAEAAEKAADDQRFVDRAVVKVARQLREGLAKGDTDLLFSVDDGNRTVTDRAVCQKVAAFFQGHGFPAELQKSAYADQGDAGFYIRFKL